MTFQNQITSVMIDIVLHIIYIFLQISLMSGLITEITYLLLHSNHYEMFVWFEIYEVLLKRYATEK